GVRGAPRRRPVRARGHAERASRPPRSGRSALRRPLGRSPCSLVKTKKSGQRPLFQEFSTYRGRRQGAPTPGGRLVPRFGGPDRLDGVDALVLRDAALLARLAGEIGRAHV